MTAKADRSLGWWGDFKLEAGATRCWRIGPLGLWIHRTAHEWRLAYEWSESDSPDAPDWRIEADCEMPEAAAHLERHVFRRTANPLSLRPLLADRPVVTSPRLPVYLPPNEKVTLFVGSPVWLEIGVGSPTVSLRELPIRRPPDTWFGPSTREGELCYASRTGAALDVENLPTTSLRAVTPLEIHNRADSALRVERLQLPVPYLSTYCSSSGVLWTQAVSLVRTEETGMASFEVQKSPPPQVKKPKLLSPAREEAEKGLLIRAFSTLFGASPKEED